MSPHDRTPFESTPSGGTPDPRPPGDAPVPDGAREARRQAAAEHGAGGSLGAPVDAGDAAVQRYRYVYHAVRAAPLPSPPASFALQLERLTADQPEQAAVETWLLRLVAAAALLVVAGFAVPVLVAASSGLARMLDPLPWRLLLMTAAGLGLGWLCDRAWTRRGGRQANDRGGATPT